ncbi:MAG: hypothetical protein ABH830_00200 [Patescibacteria group bacterium]
MKAKIWKNYFDIVILPPEEVQDFSIKLSKQLYKSGAKWSLGKKSYLPHISLFHIPVKLNKFNNFITDLEETVKSLKFGKLEINDLLFWQPHLSVLLMTDKPDWIKRLYLKIIKDSLKFFDWDYNIEKLWSADKLPKLCKKNLKKYGTPMFGRYFIPHITLGTFKKREEAENGFKKLRLNKFSFKVSSIYVCQLGTSHSCQKILKKINI